MKAKTGYWVALGAVIVLFLLSRTDKGQQVVSSATDAIASGVIGIRLNNPLNVERGQNWQGLADVQLNDRFATFISKAYGIRAWHKIMQTYRNAYGIRTIAGIINRYNPVSDGQPSTYITNVASDVGIAPSAPIDIMDRDTAFALCRAMIKVEIGSIAALLVSDADIEEGLTLAGVA